MVAGCVISTEDEVVVERSVQHTHREAIHYFITAPNASSIFGAWWLQVK